jgi:hypothetical protein
LQHSNIRRKYMSSHQQKRIMKSVSMIGNLPATAAILAALFMMPQATPATVYYVAGKNITHHRPLHGGSVAQETCR